MIRKYKRISNNDVLSPTSSENNDFGDVVGCQGFDAFVYGAGFFCVASETD